MAIAHDPNKDPAEFCLEAFGERRTSLIASELQEGRTDALDQSVSEMHCLKGHIFLGLKRLPDALAEYQKAAIIDPGNPKAFEFLGITNQAIGDIESAITAYGKAADIYGSLGDASKEQELRSQIAQISKTE